jgi:ubiquinone biosynthesis protein COQ9
MMEDKLIRALVAHVPFDGWGEKALAAAGQDMGLTLVEAGVYVPKAAAKQVEAWLELSRCELEAALAKRGLADMKVRERITAGVRLHLEMAEPNREAVRRAATLLALPQNAGLALKNSWRTADIIWRAAGDTATDFNHYSKRTILGGVLTATLFYWLQDESEGRAETWAFLDRRIEGIMRFEKTKAAFNASREKLPSLSRFLSRLRYPA